MSSPKKTLPSAKIEALPHTSHSIAAVEGDHTFNTATQSRHASESQRQQDTSTTPKSALMGPSKQEIGTSAGPSLKKTRGKKQHRLRGHSGRDDPTETSGGLWMASSISKGNSGRHQARNNAAAASSSPTKHVRATMAASSISNDFARANSLARNYVHVLAAKSTTQTPVEKWTPEYNTSAYHSRVDQKFPEIPLLTNGIEPSFESWKRLILERFKLQDFNEHGISWTEGLKLALVFAYTDREAMQAIEDKHGAGEYFYARDMLFDIEESMMELKKKRALENDEPVVERQSISSAQTFQPFTLNHVTWTPARITASSERRGHLYYRIELVGSSEDLDWLPASLFSRSTLQLKEWHSKNPEEAGPPKFLKDGTRLLKEGAHTMSSEVMNGGDKKVFLWSSEVLPPY